jgi:hypothetical protein
MQKGKLSPSFMIHRSQLSRPKFVGLSAAKDPGRSVVLEWEQFCPSGSHLAMSEDIFG